MEVFKEILERRGALIALSIAGAMSLSATASFADVATKSSVIELENSVAALAFSPDGNILAIDYYGHNGTDIFNLQKKHNTTHLAVGGRPGWATDIMHYSRNGRQLAICGIGPLQFYSIYIYDTATWQIVHSIENEITNGVDTGQSCDGLVYTPDGTSLVRLTNQMPGKSDYNVVFYDTSRWTVTSAIRTSPFITSDKRMVSNPPIGTFLVDPNDPDFDFFGSDGALAINRNGRYLAIGGRSPSVKPWHPGEQLSPGTPQLITIDLSTRTLSRVVPAYVESLDWNPDGSQIAAGIGDPVFTVKIFDQDSGAVLASGDGGPAHVLVRYTPDGKYLIEEVGKKVQVWDGHHKRLLQTIHAEPTCIAVSHDSHYFALGGSPYSILDATPMLSLITHPNGTPGKVIIYALK